MLLQNLPKTLPPRSPLKIQRSVLLALVIRELRTRVGGRWLGLMWMVLEPMLYLLLIMAFFGFRHHAVSATVELPVFLITGMLPFFLFRNLMRRLPNALNSSRGLFSYRQVKPMDAMVARACVEVGLYSAVYVSTLVLLGMLGYHWLPQSPLELMAVGLVLVMLGSGFGLLFAIVTHSRPKVNTVIGWLTYPLYFLSGVLVPVQAMPQQTQAALLWNPILHLIELSRKYFIPNYQAVDGVSLTYPAAWVLCVAALSMSLYRIYRHRLLTKE